MHARLRLDRPPDFVKVTLLAVGRVKSGPDVDMARDWLKRATTSGRSLGLGPFLELEVEGKVSSPGGERAVLLEAMSQSETSWAFDERGENLTSRAFAASLEKLKDAGTRSLTLVIGGADGLSPDVKAACARTLSFGTWTWPHRLVRAMAAEQLYRGVSILAGSPYHRD
jgi:23S rRNA (pseudouridine1915-N3)-methyltransferase